MVYYSGADMTLRKWGIVAIVTWYSSFYCGLGGSYKVTSRARAQDLTSPSIDLLYTVVTLPNIYSKTYPLVNQRNYGKSHFFIGKSTINGHFQ